MAKTLAVKYRPSTWDELVGQGAVSVILQNQIETNTVKNSYLMCGPAGCGKTTVARIFAKKINKDKGTPIEIDAASNNGVDNIRDVIIRASQKALDAEYKVFIFDECHMLTIAGWNAFLKLLEEPPAKTIFILCTTDPQKIPATILSRVQRFDFHRIPFEKIVQRLKYILEQESLNNYEIEALEYLAKLSAGGLRDAITSMDKVISYSENITLENVIKALGVANYEVFFDLTNAIIDYKEKTVVEIISKIHNEGADLKQFIKQFTLFLLDVCKYNIFKNFDFIQIPPTYEKQLKTLDDVDHQFYKDLLKHVNQLNSEIKYEGNIRPVVELSLLLLCENKEIV